MRPRLWLMAGRAGTGKTFRCLEIFREKILSAARAGLDEPSFLILPNREHRERIDALLLRDRALRGILNFHVLTIHEFIRLKIKRGPARSVTHSERAAIAARLLGAGRRPWFEKSPRPADLGPLAADLIREVKSGCLSTAEFDAASLELAGSDPYFAAKRGDLLRLLREYERACAESGALDEEEEIVRFAGELEHGGFKMRLGLVIFDGFFSFTASQLEFVRAVALAAERVVVTLTIDQRPSRARTFYFPLATQKRLLAMGFRRAHGNKTAPRFVSPGPAALENGLFGSPPRPPAGGAGGAGDSVRIFEAPGPRREIEMIVREILRLRRAEARHFSEFMVVFRDVPPLRRLLEEVFSEFGVPVDIHERKRLSDHAFIRFVIGWAELFTPGGGIRLRNLGDIVGSGYLDLDERALAEVIAAAAPRAENEEDASVFRAVAADATLSPEARGAASKLQALTEQYLGIASWAGLREFYATHLPKLLKISAGENPGAGERDARERLARILGELGLEAGSGPFSAGDMSDRLSRALESALTSSGSGDKNRVQVYDVSLALQKEYPVVFIAGLSEGVFPREAVEDPLLKDSERLFFNARAGREVFHTAAAREAGERYYFYMAAARARERLYLTYAVSDSSGRDILPSPFVAEAKAVLGPVPVTAPSRDDLVPREEECAVPRDVLKLFCRSAANAPAPPELFRAAARIESDAALRSALFLPSEGAAVSVAERLEGLRLPNRLRDPAILAEFEKSPLLSVRRLQTVDNCAYQYFARYRLGLEEDKPPGAPQQDGTVLHEVLERTFSEKFAGKRIESEADADALRNALLERLDRSFDAHPVEGERPYDTKSRKSRLRDMLSRYPDVERRRMARLAGFRPARFEWSFGAAAPALELPADGGSVRISGRVDRIDTAADGRAIIVDYKRRHHLTVNNLTDGSELQAPLYLLAARQIPGLEPAGVEFISLQTGGVRGVYRGFAPAAGGHGRLDERTFDEFLERSRAVVSGLVKKIRTADIAADSKSCRYCDYHGLCRFEGWERKE